MTNERPERELNGGAARARPEPGQHIAAALACQAPPASRDRAGRDPVSGAELAARITATSGAAGADPDYGDGTEPYCRTCGEWAGLFRGLEGWHHYRGDPAPGGVRALYATDHPVAVGWVVPPGRVLSPARLGTLRRALADAVSHRDPSGFCAGCEEEYGGLCYDHAGDLDKADAYLALARGLGIEEDT